MSDFDQTISRPYAQQPETRAAAVCRVSREDDAALLLDILGLAADPDAEAAWPVTDGLAGRKRGAR